MDEEMFQPHQEEIPVERDYRSISAWVLMVMFIVLTPVGLGLALSSLGWGLFTAGITSGIGAYILGNE